ncbi:MAG: tetratricopeptide repeat protein [Planctomycetota bacterium]|nr:tetratricopeptide repeat protein [Planctomycetota bacterium]
MSELSDAHPLQGKRIAFVGKLGGVNLREARRLVSQSGGFVMDADDLEDANVDIVILGAEQWPPTEPEDLLPAAVLSSVSNDQAIIITETQFWERLGLLEEDQHVRRLYTPAMLAELLEVPVAIIRRWHRRGLIVPAREIHRLPYFDFQEVATARHLAELLAAGASATQIEKRLAELSKYVPDVERPLAQLSVIVQGQQILLRSGEGLIEPGGQMRMDFEALEHSNSDNANVIEIHEQDVVAALDRRSDPEEPRILSFGDALDRAIHPENPEEMLMQASEYEEAGELELAMDVYRTFLAVYGPRAEVCFHLAELLYRRNDYTAARERYFMAIEIDENYVEARANLGCVLIDTGELELAIAALYGALKYHPDYPDVHYHLARTLDDLSRHEEALDHWRAFLVLAPDSPWAQQARDRLMP